MAVALAETDDVAAMLQRDLSALEEIAVAKALNYASGAIRRFTRQTISLVTDDEVILSGVYGRKLILPERPVVDVTSIGVAGLVTAPGTFTLSGDAVWVGPELAQVGNASEYTSGGWGSPSTPVTVVYSHGWAEIPEEIVGVCVGMVMRYAANPAGSGGIESETLISYSYTATNGGNPSSAYVLSDEDREILRSYRRTWFS